LRDRLRLLSEASDLADDLAQLNADAPWIKQGTGRKTAKPSRLEKKWRRSRTAGAIQ
jgi:hypothetical protein